MDWAAMFSSVAAVASGLFAGAAIYITLVEHPARMSLGDDAALAEFGPSYGRAAPLQAGLAFVAAVAGLAAFAADPGAIVLIGALVIASVIPFTLLVIFPVNHRLLGASPPPRDEAHRLLVRWGWLHGARSVSGLVAFVLFVIEIAG